MSFYLLAVSFTMEFLRDTTTDLPRIEDVHLPAIDGITVCLWLKVNRQIFWRTAMSYVTQQLPKDNDLGVWIIGNTIRIYMRNNIRTVLRNFPINSWVHFCWVWDSNGSWDTYVNGTLRETGSSDSPSFRGTFPKTNGYVLLGQDTDPVDSVDVINDPGQTFLGEITELYLYQQKLPAEEVKAAFNHTAPRNHLVAEWESFKCQANGNDVIEGPSPF